MKSRHSQHLMLALALVGLATPIMAGLPDPGTGDIFGLTVRTGTTTIAPIKIDAPTAGTVLKFSGNPASPITAGALTFADIGGNATIATTTGLQDELDARLMIEDFLPIQIDLQGQIDAEVLARTNAINGLGSLAVLSSVNESLFNFSDITTANATTTKHGLLPKLGGGTTNYLRADGMWGTPAGTFNPASPGAIGGTTPATIAMTSGTASLGLLVPTNQGYWFGASQGTQGIKAVSGYAWQAWVGAGARMQFSQASLSLASGVSLSWSSSADPDGAIDLSLYRDGANAAGWRNGTNPQTLSVYGTFTSSTNLEALCLKYNGATAAFEVGTVKGSGGGTARGLNILTNGTAAIKIASTTTAEAGAVTVGDSVNGSTADNIFYCATGANRGFRVESTSSPTAAGFRHSYYGLCLFNSVLGMTATSISNAPDGGFSRLGAASWAFGNGTAGDYSGFVQDLYRRRGSGSPEGVVTAPVGAIYHRTDGGAGTAVYNKESGAGNTGWVAK